MIKRSTGWWWIFGERSFSLATPNIAAIDLWGQKFLRPYATFSHPNALAGWLLLAGFILWDNRRKRLLALSGILLTFSRNAVLAFVVGALSFSFFANQKFFSQLSLFRDLLPGERTILNQSALKSFLGASCFRRRPGAIIIRLARLLSSRVLEDTTASQCLYSCSGRNRHIWICGFANRNF